MKRHIVASSTLEDLYNDALAVANSEERAILISHRAFLLTPIFDVRSFRQWTHDQTAAVKLTSWPLRPDAEFMQQLDGFENSDDEWSELVVFSEWFSEMKHAISRNYMSSNNAVDFFTALDEALIKVKQDIPNFPLDFSLLSLFEDDHPWYPLAKSWVGAVADSDLTCKGCPISSGTQHAIRTLPRPLRKALRDLFDPTLVGTVDDSDSLIALSLIHI